MGIREDESGRVGAEYYVTKLDATGRDCITEGEVMFTEELGEVVE